MWKYRNYTVYHLRHFLHLVHWKDNMPKTQAKIYPVCYLVLSYSQWDKRNEEVIDTALFPFFCCCSFETRPLYIIHISVTVWGHVMQWPGARNVYHATLLSSAEWTDNGSELTVLSDTRVVFAAKISMQDFGLGEMRIFTISTFWPTFIHLSNLLLCPFSFHFFLFLSQLSVSLSLSASLIQAQWADLDCVNVLKLAHCMRIALYCWPQQPMSWLGCFILWVGPSLALQIRQLA